MIFSGLTFIVLACTGGHIEGYDSTIIAGYNNIEQVAYVCEQYKDDRKVLLHELGHHVWYALSEEKKEIWEKLRAIIQPK